MYVFQDFVLNGQGHGAVGQGLDAVRFEPGLLRPYYESDGRRYCTLNLRGKPTRIAVEELQRRGINSPVFNAQSLTKEAWVELDRRIVKATRLRLRAWTDLAAANRRGVGNAMGRMTLEYQAQTDPGEAVVDMDAMSDGRRDRPLFNLKSIPLPITHSDFYFSEREIAVSRATAAPLDSTMAEGAGRRVAETIEKTLIGIETGITYGTRTGDPATAHTGTSTVYGYTNFPYRITKTNLAAPTGSNPDVVVGNVLDMIETMQSNGFFGPYMLYHSTGYSRYFNDDYFRAGSTSAIRTVRERIMEVEGIQDVRRLDFLTTNYQMILVQMDPSVAEAIDGMGVTTVQWETQGGLRQNFKVMAIQVPLLKSPYNGIAGILHGTSF